MTADGVFAPQMNSFFKVLTERLAGRVSMDYGKVKTGPGPEYSSLYRWEIQD